MVADERVDVNVTVGTQYVLKTGSKKLFPYVGVSVPYNYARRSLYDPTITVDGSGNATIVDLGAKTRRSSCFWHPSGCWS